MHRKRACGPSETAPLCKSLIMLNDDVLTKLIEELAPPELQMTAIVCHRTRAIAAPLLRFSSFTMTVDSGEASFRTMWSKSICAETATREWGLVSCGGKNKQLDAMLKISSGIAQFYVGSFCDSGDIRLQATVDLRRASVDDALRISLEAPAVYLPLHGSFAYLTPGQTFCLAGEEFTTQPDDLIWSSAHAEENDRAPVI